MKTCARVLAVAVLAFLGCKKEPPPEAHVAAAVVDAGPAKAGRPVQLTFLVTGAENGYLVPTPDDGKLRGGASEVLARWIADEGHCAGALGPAGEAACPDAGTIVISTGDNGNGQAISSYFKGEPTAEVMHLMGYAASALGNRELDWPREQFLSNTAKGGFPYLAANLVAKDDEGKKLGLLPSRVLQRRGVSVGIIGLAARKATITPMPGRMAGVEHVSDEQALAQAVAAVRQAGAGVVAVVSDGCLNDMPELLEAHADWHLAFVAGRQCDVPFPDAVAGTRLVYAGRHLNSYERVDVIADVARAGDQTFSVTTKSVEVLAAGTPPTEASTRAVVEGWKKKLDAALGDRIGFSKDGIEQESAEMSGWLTTALRERFKADVGLLNRKGVRQALPPGPITKASIYDLVPFDNQVVVAKVSGEALLAVLANVEARVTGVKAKGDGFVDASGAPVDPKKAYTVATTDYLYLGGDGFLLHKADPNPLQTNVSWQAAVIEWTKGKKSAEAHPLEALLKAK